MDLWETFKPDPDRTPPQKIVDSAIADIVGLIEDPNLSWKQKLVVGTIALGFVFGGIPALGYVMRQASNGDLSWDNIVPTLEDEMSKSQNSLLTRPTPPIQPEDKILGKESVDSIAVKPARIKLPAEFVESVPNASDFQERGGMSYTGEEIAALTDGLKELSEIAGVEPEEGDFRPLGENRYVLEWAPGATALIVDPELRIFTEIRFPETNNGGIVLDSDIQVLAFFDNPDASISYFDELANNGVLLVPYFGRNGDDGRSTVASPTGGDPNELIMVVFQTSE